MCFAGAVLLQEGRIVVTRSSWVFPKLGKGRDSIPVPWRVNCGKESGAYVADGWLSLLKV